MSFLNLNLSAYNTMKTKKYLLKTIYLIFIFTISTSFAIGTPIDSDFEKIKKRVIADVMKGSVDDAQVKLLLETLQSDGTWPGINYEDVSRTGFQHWYHTRNMISLARSYKIESSKYYKKSKVKKAVERALKNWVDNDYQSDNWWYNQFGTPRNLITLMLLIGDELPKDLVDKAQPIIGRANIDAPGARPGGDRIEIAGMQAKNMLFINDEIMFHKLVRIIESEIKQVEWVGAKYGYNYRYIPTGFSNRKAGGRGIQYDNSFHHRIDGVNNTLSYGYGYAHSFIVWAVYTAGTKYALSDDKIAQLVDYFLDGICKTAAYGKYPDIGAKNRSISRKGALHAYNTNMPEELLLTTDYRRNEIQEIADIRNDGIKPTLSHATSYWHSEHFTFQRPDFFTSVRMYSTRTFNMEEPYNSEGLLNHHRGDGANHISVTGDEYYDIASVFDYQKIPGTTVMQKSELPSEDEIQKLGKTDFVGAVTDGKYGAVAFDFMSPHDPLIARKSWFFFDDEYVCLGAGISCKQKNSVVTSINQCLLRSDVTISQKNKKVIIEKGEKQFDNIDWVFQDGIGYVFPKPTTAIIKNNTATGSWWLVNKQSDSSKDEISLDVFKFWIDHGKSPSEATYEYIVVPATTVEKMKQNISKENIIIISNTPQIQAVKHIGLKMFQAVFYKAGEIQFSEDLKLVSDTPGIVMIKTDNGTITEISVADPNRELNKMHLSISSKIEINGENFNAFWNKVTEMSEISIELPKGVNTGKSVTIKL